MWARIAAVRLRAGGTSIRGIAVIGEAVWRRWFSVGCPLLSVEDATDLRRGVNDDHVDAALDLAHLFAADHLAEDAVLGDDTLDAALTSNLPSQFADTSVLQEVGEVLIQNSDVAHFSFLLRV